MELQSYMKDKWPNREGAIEFMEILYSNCDRLWCYNSIFYLKWSTQCVRDQNHLSNKYIVLRVHWEYLNPFGLGKNYKIKQNLHPLFKSE